MALEKYYRRWTLAGIESLAESANNQARIDTIQLTPGAVASMVAFKRGLLYTQALHGNFLSAPQDHELNALDAYPRNPAPRGIRNSLHPPGGSPRYAGVVAIVSKSPSALSGPPWRTSLTYSLAVPVLMPVSLVLLELAG